MNCNSSHWHQGHQPTTELCGHEEGRKVCKSSSVRAGETADGSQQLLRKGTASAGVKGPPGEGSLFPPPPPALQQPSSAPYWKAQSSWQSRSAPAESQLQHHRAHGEEELGGERQLFNNLHKVPVGDTLQTMFASFF